MSERFILVVPNMPSLKVVICSLLVAMLAVVVKFVYDAGELRSLSPHGADKCRKVETAAKGTQHTNTNIDTQTDKNTDKNTDGTRKHRRERGLKTFRQGTGMRDAYFMYSFSLSCSRSRSSCFPLLYRLRFEPR